LAQPGQEGSELCLGSANLLSLIGYLLPLREGTASILWKV
jgi:hypothetical protein